MVKKKTTEKNSDVKTEKEIPQNTPIKERKLEKELLGILLFLGFLVVVFLLASSYFKSLNNFDYEGISFSKERAGNIPIFHHSYFFKALDGRLINYNLYLRNDPREIDRIPVEGERISFNQREVVFISVNTPDLSGCRYGTLAIASITSFLTDNQMTVKSGNIDFWNAGAKRQDWITCENTRGNKVIEITSGNETRIDVNGNCHVILVSQCDVLEAVERFEVQAIIDAQKVKIEDA